MTALLDVPAAYQKLSCCWQAACAQQGMEQPTAAIRTGSAGQSARVLGVPCRMWPLLSVRGFQSAPCHQAAWLTLPRPEMAFLRMFPTGLLLGSVLCVRTGDRMGVLLRAAGPFDCNACGWLFLSRAAGAQWGLGRLASMLWPRITHGWALLVSSAAWQLYLAACLEGYVCRIGLGATCCSTKWAVFVWCLCAWLPAASAGF